VLDEGSRAARIYGADAGAIYLVRPDGHVAGRWARQDAPGLRAALARLPHFRPN
jgi:3-(3-hydroxy-phenyl)propionate hydroxylase